MPPVPVSWNSGAQISLSPSPSPTHPLAEVYWVLCHLSNCSPAAPKILLASWVYFSLFSYSHCSYSLSLLKIKFTILLGGLQKRVRLSMVINLPHLTKSLPEHFSYFLAHNLLLMDVGKCSSRNDFVHLLPSSACRVGNWEFGGVITTISGFLEGILNPSWFSPEQFRRPSEWAQGAFPLSHCSDETRWHSHLFSYFEAESFPLADWWKGQGIEPSSCVTAYNLLSLS